MNQKVYKIYSHSDADGGIAAALFTLHLREKYKKFGWSFETEPVSHISSAGAWGVREIKWPCAILDFTLHPHFLDPAFFRQKEELIAQGEKETEIPVCYWIDHHPTGSNYSFLTKENASDVMPNVTTKWDVSAISTPGLLRTHFKELNISQKIIDNYEEFINCAEIIDGALFVNTESAYDFSSAAVKLQTLFNPSHSLIDKTLIYKKLVTQIIKNPSLEDLFDSDVLYAAIIQHESIQHNKQFKCYRSAAYLVENSVVISDFSSGKEFQGFGRFIPYQLYPHALYAVHILPKGGDTLNISCGINPWNKVDQNRKHLGHFFSKHFYGGGHAFVAGGRVEKTKLIQKLKLLVEYLVG